MRKQPIRTVARFILHKLLPGELRQKIYTIPYAVFINGFMRKIDVEKVPLFSYIEIETINRCNGKCRFCPVNVNEPQRPYAKMSEDIFNKIIQELNELEYAGEIHLFSNNEPLLDERIFQFAKIARTEVKNAYITIYTNGSLLTTDKAQELCKYVDLLVVDNYEEDGKLPTHLEQIKKLCNSDNNLKKKLVFDNKNPESILSSRGGLAPNKRKASLFGVERGCIYPYRQMVVRPDGKCSLCCNDALGKYTLGDVKEQPLVEVWNSKEYLEIRKTMKSKGRRGLRLCDSCDTHYFDRT